MKTDPAEVPKAPRRSWREWKRNDFVTRRRRRRTACLYYYYIVILYIILSLHWSAEVVEVAVTVADCVSDRHRQVVYNVIRKSAICTVARPSSEESFTDEAVFFNQYLREPSRRFNVFFFFPIPVFHYNNPRNEIIIILYSVAPVTRLLLTLLYRQAFIIYDFPFLAHRITRLSLFSVVPYTLPKQTIIAFR